MALVTGAAGTIGRAIARRLSDNGASVVVADVNLDGALALAAELPSAIAVEIDISNQASAEAGVAQAIDRFGRLDILVNNAGVNSFAHRVNIDTYPVEEWDRITRIDLDGLYLMSRAALMPMLERAAGGRIINIASVVGLAAMRLQSPFVAAKAGIIHLTRSMALELGPQGVLTGLDHARGHPLALLWRRRQVRRPDRGVHTPHPARPAGHRRGDRRGGAVPCLPRRWLHQRPGACRGWRLDRRIHDVRA